MLSNDELMCIFTYLSHFYDSKVVLRGFATEQNSRF